MKRKYYFKIFFCLLLLLLTPAAIIIPAVVRDEVPLNLKGLSLRAPWQEGRDPGTKIQDTETAYELIERYYPWYAFLNQPVHGDFYGIPMKDSESLFLPYGARVHFLCFRYQSIFYRFLWESVLVFS